LLKKSIRGLFPLASARSANFVEQWAPDSEIQTLARSNFDAALSALRFPAALESRGAAVLSAPVWRGQRPLDVGLFPPNPCGAHRMLKNHFSASCE
jgi:hypothetical protein